MDNNKSITNLRDNANTDDVRKLIEQVKGKSQVDYAIENFSKTNEKRELKKPKQNKIKRFTGKVKEKMNKLKGKITTKKILAVLLSLGIVAGGTAVTANVIDDYKEEKAYTDQLEKEGYTVEDVKEEIEDIIGQEIDKAIKTEGSNVDISRYNIGSRDIKSTLSVDDKDGKNIYTFVNDKDLDIGMSSGNLDSSKLVEFIEKIGSLEEGDTKEAYKLLYKVYKNFEKKDLKIKEEKSSNGNSAKIKMIKGTHDDYEISGDDYER